MFDLSYVIGSFSPFHRGHMRIVMDASVASRDVMVIVSKKGRDFVTTAKKIEFLEKCIKPILPENVVVMITDGSPVRETYERLGAADVNLFDFRTFSLYGTPDDLNTIWVDASLQRYVPRLFTEGRISRVSVDRSTTEGASATMVRHALKTNDRELFDSLMPDKTDKGLAWQILKI